MRVEGSGAQVVGEDGLKGARQRAWAKWVKRKCKSKRARQRTWAGMG